MHARLMLPLLAALFLAGGAAAQAPPPTERAATCAVLATPTADLRYWLAHSPDGQMQPFTNALGNDLLTHSPCLVQQGILNAPTPFAVLQRIMEACTDRYRYPSVTSSYQDFSTDESGKALAVDSSSTSPLTCGCSDTCSKLLNAIQVDCWEGLLTLFCAYDVRSVSVGASLEAVFQQLSNSARQCLTTPPIVTTCAELASRTDPRTDIRIYDVANTGTGLSTSAVVAALVGVMAALLMI